ncbi:phage antirepressor KilAC domain-containing protein [Salipiger manganoxidans]|uniref:BRO family protein n=1 Tax=Salipiger marinus TaxID=555512 RepID=UPI001E3833DA|nr:phage antirepressor KilAC domain-containing protein [Salipiger manganoxidans]MCD1619121.1 phage antirepressor KilAC domain-containing protein [Salipiger manganoxidans]
MGKMVPFNFDGAPIRVLEISGEPWFVGKDVAEALGYSNPQKAVRDHCRKAQDVGGERNVHPSDLDPQTKIIPEGDVYRLIVRSKLPSAERFEALVMDEILPTIRKTGGYGQAATIDLSDPAQLVPLLTSYAQRTQIAEAKVSEMSPKAEAFDRLDVAEGNLTVRPAAKVLGFMETKLTKWMELNTWAFRQNGKGPLQPYADKRKAGLLDVKLRHFDDPKTGEPKVDATLTITPKGLARLAQLLPKEGGTA